MTPGEDTRAHGRCMYSMGIFNGISTGVGRNIVRMGVQPIHYIELTVLPPLERTPAEEPAAFAERTASALAAELGVPATRHSTEDKRVLLKRVKKAGKAEVLRRGVEAVLHED